MMAYVLPHMEISTDASFLAQSWVEVPPSQEDLEDLEQQRTFET